MTKLLSILTLATLAQPASFIAPISKSYINNDSNFCSYKANINTNKTATINWFSNKIDAPTYGFKYNEVLHSVAQHSNEIIFKNDASTDGACCGWNKNDKIYAKYDNSTNKLIIWSSNKISFVDENSGGIFERCQHLTHIDFSNADFSRLTNMRRMFASCSVLSSLDLSTFDTKNVTNMEGMFDYCVSLITLDLSTFDSSNLKTVTNMFHHCLHLKTILVTKKFQINNELFKKTPVFGFSVDLIGGNGTKYDYNKSYGEYARVDTLRTPGYFTSKDNNFTKTDYTVHYEGNSGDCYDITSDKFVKGPGTYFKEPESTFIDLETTCRSTRLRMLLQQYSFDILVPANTRRYQIKLTVPLRMHAYLNGYVFGTTFDASAHLFNQGSDEGRGKSPDSINCVSFDYPNSSDTIKLFCNVYIEKEYQQYLYTTFTLSNQTSKPQIQKCYFSMSLYIRGQIDWKNGNTGALLKLLDQIKIEKI